MVTRILRSLDITLRSGLFRAVAARPLAWFRIAFGALLLAYAAASHAMFALAAQLQAAAAAAGAPRHPAKLLSVIDLPPAELAAWFPAGYALFVVAALALMLGAATRVAALVVWLGTIVFTTALAPGTNTGDQVLCQAAFGVFVAALAGHLQRELAVDARWPWRPRESCGLVPSWPHQLFRVQLTLIYFATGWLKWMNPDWYNGDALYYIMAPGLTRRFALSALLLDGPLVAALTYGTVVLECVVLPLGLWSRRWRVAALGAGVAFHLGVELAMRIPVFGPVMLVLYLACLEGADWQRLGAWPRRAMSGAARSQPSAS